ncbi:MAG TPA: IclR family transcriptional regulator [Casimicrobiaceae bacterium]|nr:IclR family transcriptional regulator [Casimicrobiaceae bacterium]
MGFRSAKLHAVPAGDDFGASATLRAFALLECIAAAEQSPTLEELTRASGLPKPTVHRILQLMMRGGLVEREVHDKRYVVGSRVCALSLAVQMRSPRRRERQAILARLVEAIGETCNFTMLDGNEILYLERVETSANVRLHMKAGSRVPLHCTASGKLLLSEMEPAQVSRLLGADPLPRYTERTIVSTDALLRELAKIRASGVGTDVSEYLDGSVCLAVPVRDARGRLCAAVAVHGPAPRMSLKKGYSFLPAMREAAAAIAATLMPPAREAPPRVAKPNLSRTKRIAA